MEKNVKAGGAALTNEEILNILRKKWKEDFKEAKASAMIVSDGGPVSDGEGDELPVAIEEHI